MNDTLSALNHIISERVRAFFPKWTGISSDKSLSCDISRHNEVKVSNGFGFWAHVIILHLQIRLEATNGHHHLNPKNIVIMMISGICSHFFPLICYSIFVSCSLENRAFKLNTRNKMFIIHLSQPECCRGGFD